MSTRRTYIQSIISYCITIVEYWQISLHCNISPCVDSSTSTTSSSGDAISPDIPPPTTTIVIPSSPAKNIKRRKSKFREEADPEDTAARPLARQQGLQWIDQLATEERDSRTPSVTTHISDESSVVIPKRKPSKQQRPSFILSDTGHPPHDPRPLVQSPPEENGYAEKFKSNSISGFQEHLFSFPEFRQVPAHSDMTMLQSRLLLPPPLRRGRPGERGGPDRRPRRTRVLSRGEEKGSPFIGVARNFIEVVDLQVRRTVVLRSSRPSRLLHTRGTAPARRRPSPPATILASPASLLRRWHNVWGGIQDQSRSQNRAVASPGWGAALRLSRSSKKRSSKLTQRSNQ